MKHLTLSSRFSRRFLGFVFLAALSAGVAVAPLRIAAQQPAPAAASEPAATAPAATSAAPAKPEAAKDDPDEAYLHSNVVKALARILHLDIDTADKIFLILNFAIVALAIVIPLVRIFPKILRKRAQTLHHDLESARKVTEDAHTRLTAVEAKLAKLDEEIAEIRTHVEQESNNDKVRIKASIEEESNRIVAAAEQEIGAAAAHARRGLRNFAADLAIEQAAKQMTLTPETDRALIAEFMREAAKGGQN